MRLIRFIVLLLVVVGALNWGFWGVFQYDLVQDLLGSDTSLLARTVYTIIGLAGVYAISFFFSCSTCGCCHSKVEHKDEENK
ncbi:MAG TPA: DUF378 domain-containing protein [Chlamydiales bacterium]|nr:DUF378 domain-containing protein [Chlamydiales bacterium]